MFSSFGKYFTTACLWSGLSQRKRNGSKTRKTVRILRKKWRQNRRKMLQTLVARLRSRSKIRDQCGHGFLFRKRSGMLSFPVFSCSTLRTTLPRPFPESFWRFSDRLLFYLRSKMADLRCFGSKTESDVGCLNVGQKERLPIKKQVLRVFQAARPHF